MEKSDYEQWRYSAAGRWFFDEFLRRELEDRDSYLGKGAAMAESAEQTAMKYVELMGFGAGIAFVQNVDPFGSTDEAESSGTPSSDSR